MEISLRISEYVSFRGTGARPSRIRSSLFTSAFNEWMRSRLWWYVSVRARRSTFWGSSRGRFMKLFRLAVEVDIVSVLLLDWERGQSLNKEDGSGVPNQVLWGKMRQDEEKLERVFHALKKRCAQVLSSYAIEENVVVETQLNRNKSSALYSPHWVLLTCLLAKSSTTSTVLRTLNLKVFMIKPILLWVNSCQDYGTQLRFSVMLKLFATGLYSYSGGAQSLPIPSNILHFLCPSPLSDQKSLMFWAKEVKWYVQSFRVWSST